MRQLFAVTILVGSSLVSMSACSDSTAPVTSKPGYVVESNTVTDSISTTVGGGWSIVLEATALGDVSYLSNSFKYEVKNDKLGVVVLGDSERRVVGFSSVTGEINQVHFWQIADVHATATGKFEMTAWPSADPSKKKRFVMLVTKQN